MISVPLTRKLGLMTMIKKLSPGSPPSNLSERRGSCQGPEHGIKDL